MPDSLDSLPKPGVRSVASSSQVSTVLDWWRQWPVLLVLLLAGGLSSATGTIVAPVFPEVIDQFQVDSQWAGLLVSAHTLTLALASPTLGLLANRIGGGRIFSGVPSGLWPVRQPGGAESGILGHALLSGPGWGRWRWHRGGGHWSAQYSLCQ
ncbi:hypothetical protein [Halomicronema hongdechloris]|uniref:hypothetical protein n=1 Tax=Halomicronema hongdechloris TaxID=1209493 RepID=UPI001CEC546E|nr:hypothetical protein [Halomicronema hongdechloris]